jgi:predicted ATPase/signal transduction histidine kinase
MDGISSSGAAMPVRSLSRDGSFEVVYSSGRTRVRRWRSRTDPQDTLIVKDPLGEGAGSRLQRERAVLTRLADVPGVPHLRQAGEGLDPDATVEEDAGSRTLADAIPSTGWPAEQVVELGIALARTLAAIHRRGVVHRDVNPPNVVLSPTRGPVLIDFDLATTYAQERPAFAHTNDVLGTLPYLAPEQTGRTGRVIDHRADLYSLGATLYEAASGGPPFGFGSPLQLVHDQLARVPAPLSTVNHEVPQGLSLVVARLLEKEPDGRYESAEGLLHDLCVLRDVLAGHGPADFRPGEQDFPLQLSAPSRLIGRDAEAVALRAALHTAVGTGTCVLVDGAQGVGKSALVNELRLMVADIGGWYVCGTFEQHWQEPSSDAVAQVMRGLGRLLLAESEEQLAGHRSRIREALGPNLGLLTALPEYQLLLEGEPAADQQDPVRRVRACLDLLRAVASADLPLVMVLEDLHLAAAGDLDLLDALLTEGLPAGLLVVGTYRSSLIDGAHPLAAKRFRWTELGVDPATTHLQNLPPHDLQDLLAAVLRLPVARVRELAEAVGQVSAGNPFDTLELLNALRADGVIAPGGSGWGWDVEQIRRHGAEHTMVDLLAEQVARLPAGTRAALEVMACLGERVPAVLLAASLGSPAAATDLGPALDEGLLLHEPGTDGRDELLSFRHDRIRQVVQAAMSETRHQELHLAIARRLSRDPTFESQAGEQYLTVFDSRGGRQVLGDSDEALTAAELLHRAGQLAGPADPGLADRLLAAAADLLARMIASGSGARAQTRAAVSRLAAQVQVDRHATLYRLGRLDAADAHFAAIAARCTDPMELVDPTCVQIASLAGQARSGEAVALALQLLAAFDVEPPQDLDGWLDAEWTALVTWVEQADGDEQQRPEPDDPRLLAVTRLIHHALVPAFVAQPRTHQWLLLTGQRIWREHGPCQETVRDAAAAAAVLIGLREDYRTAYRLGELALAVGEAHGYEPATSAVRFLFASCLGHWFEPLEDQIGQLRVAREALLQGGDPLYAAMTSSALAGALLDRGPTLDSCAREIDAGLALAARTGSQNVTGTLLAYRQLLRALRGETFPAGTFEGPDFSEAFHLADPSVTPMARAIYRVNRALGAALLGDPAALRTHIAHALERLSFVPGFWVTAQARTLQALAAADRLRAALDDADLQGSGLRGSGLRGFDRAWEPDPDVADPLQQELDDCRDWLAARAGDAPDNVVHLLALVDAERHRARGELQAAAVAFDRALGRTSPHRRPWQEALIAERAGLFLLDQGQTHLGHQMLARARAGYEEWGARAVVARLEREHPLLRTVAYQCAAYQYGEGPQPRRSASVDLIPGAVPPLRSGRFESGPGGSNGIDANTIDLLGVLTASQALGQEQNLDRLRDRIAQVVGELTGATAVRVLLWNEEARGWFLLGSDEPDGPDHDGGPAALSLDEAGERGLLPLSAVRVVERTHEPLLVPDATRDDRFARDRFLEGVDQCSLMVVPIRSQGTSRAMLVLENRLSRGAFTRDRLGAVLLIAGQLAVSLDNARAERFRSLVQRSSDVMLVCGRDGRVGYGSSAAAGLFGVAAGQLVGQSIETLVHVKDRAALLARLRAGGRDPADAEPQPQREPRPDAEPQPQREPRPEPQPHSRSLECRVLRGPDDEPWVEIAFTDLTTDPAVGGVVLHLRDVTERHRLEIELRHAQKMESVGQLAAGVAHEINTPIQFVGDNLTFLGTAFADLCRVVEAFRAAMPAPGVQLPQELAARWSHALAVADEADLDYLLGDVPDALSQTRDGVARVARIVRAMKASAYPTGEQRSQTDLNELVRNTLIIANGEFKEVADVRDELEDVPPIWAYPGDLQQVVLNLVVNASQAIAEAVAAGGPRGCITVRSRREDGDVVLEVADTGVGIPPEIAGRVFEQFFTTKPPGVGTGQGLSLAYYLVHDRHGGSITFTSRPGVATTFTVRLPIGQLADGQVSGGQVSGGRVPDPEPARTAPAADR